VIRTFSKFASAALLVTLTSCSSLGDSMLPAGLGDVLGNITGFSTEIGEWTSGLGSMLDTSALGKLQGYVDQAGELGDTVSGFQGMVSDAMADPLGTIGGKLTEMGSLQVDKLANLIPAEQMSAVQGFAQSAEDVGALTNDFLAQFGG
jgi:hypothetical protein